MSKSCTREEKQMPSEEMKAVSHTDYEGFWGELDERKEKAALERYAKVQTSRSNCPRCGKPTMKDPLHKNALSRVADIYVCNACRTAEALDAHIGVHTMLRGWAIFRDIKELLDE